MKEIRLDFFFLKIGSSEGRCTFVNLVKGFNITEANNNFENCYDPMIQGWSQCELQCKF